jgi:hypothetical protein
VCRGVQYEIDCKNVPEIIYIMVHVWNFLKFEDISCTPFETSSEKVMIEAELGGFGLSVFLLGKRRVPPRNGGPSFRHALVEADANYAV